jgi:hypothetical protein
MIHQPANDWHLNVLTAGFLHSRPRLLTANLGSDQRKANDHICAQKRSMITESLRWDLGMAKQTSPPKRFKLGMMAAFSPPITGRRCGTVSSFHTYDTSAVAGKASFAHILSAISTPMFGVDWP